MHQPVDWHEWSAEAFAQAHQQDKPILLDIGAVWCHWCHVMDRESYDNPETAAEINKFFIPIKVDRDERPDLDARYQAAAASISGQGGWPLTAFLTPQGNPYFAGTYFPPVDQHGRPSFRRVLFTMAEAFQKQRADVDDSAASVLAAIQHNETFEGRAPNPGDELVGKIIAATLQQFDPRFGGFGSQPKFPHSAALDLLLDEAGREAPAAPGKLSAGTAALATLERMSRGGIYDHLAGGFHRYSVDEKWVVPHFEKMSYDNSELLKNYVHAFQAFGEPECARIARETLHWIDECLSDHELGGFYASQDADFSLEDDGDYFTWTRSEAAGVLTPQELAIAEAWFDIGPIGDMHHNFEKNVLHIDLSLSQLAATAKVTVEEAAALIAAAKSKLYAARKLRPTPFIDHTVYTGWNAMIISAGLLAGRVLNEPKASAFALRTLDLILDRFDPDGSLGHVIRYAEQGLSCDQVAATLDDFVLLGHAALDAWEVTGEYRFFTSARDLARAAIARFYDQENGGFFDTEPPAAGKPPLGALAARRKPLQDAPSPSGNSVAAHLLVRLAELTGDHDLRAKALATYECFAGLVEHFGLHCASYALGLRRLSLPPTQIVILGADALADALEQAALQGFAVTRSVIRLRNPGSDLPPAFAATIPYLPPQSSSFAVVCANQTCGLPLTSPDTLRAALA
jgi:uncharacterized protein YyaL (SSP411 family)